MKKPKKDTEKAWLDDPERMREALVVPAFAVSSFTVMMTGDGMIRIAYGEASLEGEPRRMLGAFAANPIGAAKLVDAIQLAITRLIEAGLDK